MSHTINIGTTPDDPRKLSKSTSWSSSPSVELYEPCSVMNPVFILKYKASYATCNYLYFPDWNRYYFIDNMTMLSGGKCQLSCTVDTLMSYKDEIKGLQVNVVRNEDKGKANPYFADSSFSIRSGFQHYTIPFSGGQSFIPGKYVLSWIGGPRNTEQE